MSLLATASEWKTDNETTTKKRTPTIGLKKPKAVASSSSGETSLPFHEYMSYDTSDTSSHQIPVQIQHHSIEKMTEYNDDRNQRIQKVLENMYVNVDNAGEKLANFNPIPRPSMMVKNGMYPSPTDATTSQPPTYEGFANPSNPLQPPPPKIDMNYSGLAPLPNVGYLPGNSKSKYTNYHTEFTSGMHPTLNRNNTNHSGRYSGGGDANYERLMEKINHMIHLLEEQQYEKTNNVMEEFILYSLLGVFMIYVLDSFTRAGKYVR